MTRKTIYLYFAFCNCLVAVWLGIAGNLAGQSVVSQKTVAPEISLDEFVLHPDCQMELIAREPQVIDPVAIRFDEHGRLWVVEMRDYPLQITKRPQSKIKILEDRDRDGFFETATLFADHIKFPTGIQPWRNGVIATLEGQVVYLADNDGDLRCDEERVLFTGFATANTQLRANHPTLGPDGKIYIANGLRNGEIQSPRWPGKISLTGKDFRFDPATYQFAAVTGQGQFGMSFDSAANRYVCTNRNPLKRIVFEAEYLKVAGAVRISQTVVDVAAAGPQSRLYPISETWTTSNLHANQFTAACGVHIFEDTGLSPAFYGNAFTCDPTANVVHREIISFSSDKVVGRAVPARPKIEFLASSHPDFRPVNLSSGPDGSLYVVDMRRSVIEHPQFMPPELKKRPDLRTGDHLGRIYRISTASSKRDFEMRTLDPERDLFGRGQWWRDQAHRLLVQNPEAADLNQIRNGLSRPESHPAGIIRALTFLQSQNRLRPIDYHFAASHFADTVRAFAMRVCENVRPELIRAGITDESDRVRFQALLSCVKSSIELTDSELKTVAFNSAQNPWIKQAWLIAAQSRASQLLATLLTDVVERSQKSRNHEHIMNLCLQLVPLALKSDEAELSKLALLCLENTHRRDLALEPLSLAFLKLPSLRSELARLDPDKLSRLSAYLLEEITRPEKGAVDNQAQWKDPLDTRLQLLAWIGSRDPVIERMALEEKDPRRRLAALRALQVLSDDTTWIQLVGRFRSLTFAERAEVLRASLARKSVAMKLLTEIQNGKLKTAELGLDSRKRILAHRDPEVKKLASTILAIRIPADRQQAFENYKAALDLEADAKKGKPLFEKNCAACHQLGSLGNRIGPDISDTRTKSKSQLLLDIIRPNAAIDNNYVEYLIATVDGRTRKGILVENNATGITLRKADNQVVVVPADEIERIQSSGKSLMPVGLEQGLTIQQMADLISYLQNWRYLENDIPFLENSNAK